MPDSLSSFRFERLAVGQTATTSKTITEADITLYAAVSLDINPLHIDANAAAEGPFRGRVAHGMIGAGLISATLGNQLPGHGAIYLSQTLRFLHPVRLGDTVMARVEIKELDTRHKHVNLLTECFVGTIKVIEGEALVLFNL